MAWMKSHSELERHPKLFLFRQRMGWSKNEAVGFLHRFWWMVLEYSPMGVVSGLLLAALRETLDMPSVQIDKALAAMEDKEIGLLDRRDGMLIVHDWFDYARAYLAETKFKDKPEKMEECRRIHGVSMESPRRVNGASTVEEKRGDKKEERRPLSSRERRDRELEDAIARTKK